MFLVQGEYCDAGMTFFLLANKEVSIILVPSTEDLWDFSVFCISADDQLCGEQKLQTHMLCSLL